MSSESIHQSDIELPQLLADDRCNEHMVRIAMRAHAALGNQAAVVRQYETCIKSLKEEYGTRPSAVYELLNGRMTQLSGGANL